MSFSLQLVIVGIFCTSNFTIQTNTFFQTKVLEMKINKTVLLIILLLCTLHMYTTAQTAKEIKDAEKLVPKEFAIPASPLFDLLGAAPNQVARSSNLKDFKVDWSFKNWRVNPNIAVQGQPIWEIFYNKKSIEKYQSASNFQRMLASLDLSVGSITNDISDRRLGGALKMNLFTKKDPLRVKGAYDEIQKTFDEELVQLKKNEAELLKNLDSLTKPSDLQKAREALKENDALRASFYSRKNDAVQEKAKQFVADNWNASYIDVAYGKIYSYATDSAGSFKKLRINRNTGNGAWVNFGKGIGKRGLVSGLIRSSFYEEEVTFNLKNDITGEETPDTTIAANKLYTIGLNFRYGGPVFNFFAEVIYEGKTLKTPIAAVNEVFKAPSGNSIVTSTVMWDVVHPYTVNFGGDWRIGRNVVLNYGMRLVMDKNYKAVSFTPIANISCMMR
jgi:hypothetical protein